MIRKVFTAAVLLAAALFLCGAAQADIQVNEFPGFDAIPGEFLLMEGGIPELPYEQVMEDGTIVVTGLKAWNTPPEVMTGWIFEKGIGWYSDSTETYDDKIVVRSDMAENEAVYFQLPETEDSPVQIAFFIQRSFYNASDDPTQGYARARIQFKESGISAICYEDGSFEIDREDDQANMNVLYSESGSLVYVWANMVPPDGYGVLGSYKLTPETDCLTGEQFIEITVSGDVDPDARPFRLADETLPVKTRKEDGNRYDFLEGEPALPVLDPLPAEGLPEVWPADYPDGFPEFSCEAAGGKYIWTVEDLTPWGGRVNLPGAIYSMSKEDNTINYFNSASTMRELPEDKLTIVSEDENGFFHADTETERGPYRMILEGNAPADGDGNLKPTLMIKLYIYEDRDITVKYFSDGSTVQKQISVKINDSLVTGSYGEDNRLEKTD